jgi:DNA-binding transcriptional LysR family regulator
MDIDEIQTFLAIAELGGFTRAGRRLHRSQPAISRRLGILEQELGAPMFERLRGRARLTEAGRAFLPHAEAALASLRDGREAVRGLQAGIDRRARSPWSAPSPIRTSSMSCANSRGAPRMSGSSSARPRAAK